MARRPSQKTRVPTWEVNNAGVDGGTLSITCPRRDCGETAHVAKRAWLEGRGKVTVATRPCPTCFRAAWIPSDVYV